MNPMQYKYKISHIWWLKANNKEESLENSQRKKHNFHIEEEQYKFKLTPSQKRWRPNDNGHYSKSWWDEILNVEFYIQ